MEIKLDKPKIGEPCNGCGICCMLHICNTGAFLLKKVKYFGEKQLKGPCPALIDNKDGTFSCGFVVSPGRFIRSKYRPEVISRTVITLIGAGTGCDEIGYDEDDPVENAKLEHFIQEAKSNSDWREKATKAVELLHKF